MVPNPRRAVSTVRTVIGTVSERNVSFMAAGIAYQAFLSLLPLLILTFFLVSVVGDEGLASEVVAITEGILPESANQLLGDSIEGSAATAGTSIIGVVTLLWGSLKIFRGLDTAFSEIYGTTAENSIVSQIRDGLIVFGAIAFSLAAAAGATVAYAFFPDLPYIGLLNPLLLVVGLSIAFYPMYYFFPDLDVSKREIVPGVLFAAAGWAALQALFQVYVAFAGGSQGGDALGALILLLTWLYFGGFVLLIGAVVNATVAGRLPEDDDLGTGEDAVDESGTGDAADESDAEEIETDDRERDEDADRPAPEPTVVDRRDRVRREHLEARLEELERERDLLAEDVDAQRSRRYDLEDELEAVRDRVRTLERENARLRDELSRRRPPGWRRALSDFANRITFLRVGTVRHAEE